MPYKNLVKQREIMKMLDTNFECQECGEVLGTDAFVEFDNDHEVECENCGSTDIDIAEAK